MQIDNMIYGSSPILTILHRSMKFGENQVASGIENNRPIANDP